MRESRDYSHRQSGLATAKRKVFLAFEGEKTEFIYFKALSDYPKQSGLNPMVELIPLKKEGSECGWSNPEKLLSALEIYLMEIQTGKLTKESYIRKLHEETNKQVSEARIRSLFEQLGEFDSDLDLIEDIEMVNNKLLKVLSGEEILYQAILDFKFQPVTYDSQIDHVYLIADRDAKSFKEDQYEHVMHACTDKDIQFCPTNPNFELWLLLHFRPIKPFEKEKFKRNDKEKAPNGKRKKRTYTEIQLKIEDSNYRKNKLNTQLYVGLIDQALKNCSDLESEVEKLKNEIGSSIPKLIQDLRDTK